MKILLDTHCWLWMAVTPERFSGSALDLVSDPDNRLFLSAVSAWEISIKHKLGKLELPLPPQRYVPSRMEATGVEGLAASHAHGLRAGGLPSHHRDPFDRMLVAQAQIERMPLLTADHQIHLYDLEVIEAI
ncbi:MAG: type II toxin-antitoxin system VapC family toxin [Thermoanaerobaculales bacterium]|nr:type II toxin-antitoxin system VapC family toxin [Thermoanaerobaculales bacterium]